MNKCKLLLIVCLSLASATAIAKGDMESLTRKVMKVAVEHCKNMDSALDSGRTPRTFHEGKFVDEDIEWWCSGFYPGTLWYLYEYTGDEQLRRLAEKHTEQLAPIQWFTKNHDVGFMIFCSYGNGYRLTGNEAYAEVIRNASNSLASRFNPFVGLIRSWDSRRWQYAVIIDNMMNLEMLMWAAEKFSDNSLRTIAITHANTTLRTHFRDDASTVHLADFNPKNGTLLLRQTVQGYADDSRWARGQAWALYGYTMMYRTTGADHYLTMARRIADMIISYLPEDGIPYWDFNAPDIPNALRDASAGAITASALIELSGFSPEKRSEYLAIAEKQLRTLASKEYMAPAKSNGNFLLRHSVGSLPGNSEVDVPLTYADYYFIEALMRWRKITTKP